jgi:hypothetical protein
MNRNDLTPKAGTPLGRLAIALLLSGGFATPTLAQDWGTSTRIGDVPHHGFSNGPSGTSTRIGDIAQIAELVTPSVVTIIGEDGLGAGVVVDASGVLVTNLHVVKGETKLSVELANGDIYDDVSVIDVDERRDLILLKIKAFNLTPVVFGDSDDVAVGERVILVGSPEGLSQTVSEGVISALRDFGDGYRMLQTSAPASPGSSGGGMFNASGDLIGVVTSQFPGGQNLNFAVPINYARGLLSTEPTMSLVELASRFSDSEVLAGVGAVAAADRVAPESVQRLRELVRLSTGFEEDEEVSGRWWTGYEGRNLDTVPVSVEVTSGDLVLMKGWTADPDAELSFEQLKGMLTLNGQLDFAKVSFDVNDSVWAHAAIPLHILDVEVFDFVAAEVALATDVFAGIIEGGDDGRDLDTARDSDFTREELNQIASEFNSVLPMMLDRETQLMHVSSDSGMLTYNYRLVNRLASEIDTDVLIQSLRPGVLRQVCSDPTSSELLRRGVTVRYLYVGKMREYAGSYHITPADCGF